MLAIMVGVGYFAFRHAMGSDQFRSLMASLIEFAARFIAK
jgi:hypothetical protein